MCYDRMTYNLSQEEDVLPADKEYALLYVGIEVSDEDTLDRVLEDQVRCRDPSRLASAVEFLWERASSR
jgi:hypothetical protein